MKQLLVNFKILRIVGERLACGIPTWLEVAFTCLHYREAFDGGGKGLGLCPALGGQFSDELRAPFFA